MPKRRVTTKAPTGSADESRFLAVLLSIPNDVFTRMVMRSGLTPDDARALNALFRKIKE